MTGLDRVRQLEKPQRVGDMAAAFADDLGEVVLGVLELVDRATGSRRASSSALRSARCTFSMIASSSASRSLTSRTTTGTSCRPARCAARQRRSPAMISKVPAAPAPAAPTIGWMMPRSLDRGGELVELGLAKVGADCADWAAGTRSATRRWPRARSAVAVGLGAHVADQGSEAAPQSRACGSSAIAVLPKIVHATSISSDRAIALSSPPAQHRARAG